jgi:hypothetical protein
MATTQGTDQGNLSVRLFDAKGDQLKWGSRKNAIKKVTAVVGEACRETEPCPQTPVYKQGGDVEFELTAPTEKAIRINLALTYGNSDEAQALAPIVTMLKCSDSSQSLDILVPTAPSPDQETETATLLVRGHLCQRGGCEKVEHTRSVAIADVFVKAISTVKNGQPGPPDPDPAPFEVVKKEGVAFLSLPVGSTYEIDVRSHDKCGQTCTGMPVQFPVLQSGDLTLDVCFESRERMVALFFVDSCGQPANLTDVYRLDDGQPITIDANGRAQVPAKGHLRLSSLSSELRPSAVSLEDGAAQVIHVHQPAAQKALKAGAEDCIFVFEDLTRDSAAFLQVLNLKGELITTLHPDAQGQVSYTPKDPNETLQYSAYINGKHHETVKMKAAKN